MPDKSKCKIRLVAAAIGTGIVISLSSNHNVVMHNGQKNIQGWFNCDIIAATKLEK